MTYKRRPFLFRKNSSPQFFKSAWLACLLFHAFFQKGYWYWILILQFFWAYWYWYLFSILQIEYWYWYFSIWKSYWILNTSIFILYWSGLCFKQLINSKLFTQKSARNHKIDKILETGWHQNQSVWTLYSLRFRGKMYWLSWFDISKAWFPH